MESRNEAALRLSHTLSKSENAVDAAYRALGEFSMQLPELQKAAGLSPVYGHEVFGMISRSQAAIVAARGDLVEAHNRFSAIQRKLGIEVVATGPINKPDPGEETPKPTGRDVTPIYSRAV